MMMMIAYGETQREREREKIFVFRIETAKKFISRQAKQTIKNKIQRSLVPLLLEENFSMLILLVLVHYSSIIIIGMNNLLFVVQIECFDWISMIRFSTKMI